jgi:arylsulfatase A-like enzyme
MPIIEDGESYGYFSPYGNPRLTDGPKGEYLTERLTEEAVRFLKQQIGSKKPFYMNFWYYSVHTPIQAKEDKIRKYEALVTSNLHHTNPVYAAMVEHVDESIGRVMQTLKETGLDDNTIVIFTSDNGGSLGGTGKNKRLKEKITSNFPLRAGKGTMYEGGIRVPFIVRWNNKISRDTNSNPIISCDLYPTILGLTKAIGNEVQNASMDGEDLTKVFLEDASLGRALYWHFPHYNGFGATPYSIIRKGKWKLIEFFEHNTPELYDLESDIGEQNNLASQYPELVREMLGDLRNWREEAKVQMPTVNPDFQPEVEDLP